MSKIKRARTVSLEGPDGQGKTTQVRLLAEELRSLGKRVCTVKLPRYESLTGKLILRMLKSGSAVTWPNIFQIVQWLDKLVFQLFHLSRMFERYDYILFDRWHASMWAYGVAAGASERLTDIFVSTLHDPDLVVVLHGNSKRAEKQDAYEADQSFQNSVALHYVLWMCTHDSTCTVDSDETPDRVTQSILEKIRSTRFN